MRGPGIKPDSVNRGIAQQLFQFGIKWHVVLLPQGASTFFIQIAYCGKLNMMMAGAFGDLF